MAEDNPNESQAGVKDQAEAYVDEIGRAESVLKQDYEREQQEAERKLRIEEARRILARHREQQMQSDPQLSGSNKEIMTHSAYAAAAALVTPRLIPSSLLALGSVAGIQLKMLSDMAKIFGLPFSEDTGKALIASVTGSLGTTALALPTVAGMLRLLPMVGGLVSKLSYSAVAFASTYAVGKVFQAHFASGGTLLNFDPIKARDLYKTTFQQGARMAPQGSPA
jgi:uncharacterized protein (DUF697 family)